MSIIRELSWSAETQYKGYIVEIDIIYFDRKGSESGIGTFLASHSKEVYLLDPSDLKESKNTIYAANIDFLLYFAINTEKFTFLLAHSR